MTRAESGPRISVIVPSFNQAPYLRRCLDSILEQQHRPLEILVIDGASTDGTVEILRRYDGVPELRWWSEPDDGPAHAVNRGLERATGDIGAIMSSDDYYLPGAFVPVVERFRDDPGLGLVYGDVQSVDVHERVRRIWVRPPHTDARCIALCVCIPQSSAFFDLALAREVGGWRDRYHTADWDFWLRLMFRTRTEKIDGVLSAWRMYPGQRTRERRVVFEDFRRMIDESEEIRAAGWQVRQAARAARQLIGVSYDRRGDWSRLRYLAAATLRYPPVWRHVPDKRAMVPSLGRVVRSARTALGGRR